MTSAPASITLAEAAVLLASGRGIAGERLQQAVECPADPARRGRLRPRRRARRRGVRAAPVAARRSARAGRGLRARRRHRPQQGDRPAPQATARGARVGSRARRRHALASDHDAVSTEVHRRDVSRALRQLVGELPSSERRALTATATGAGFAGSGLGRSSHYRALDRARLRLTATVRSRIAGGLALPAVLASQAGIRPRHPRTGLRRGRGRHRERRARAARDRALGARVRQGDARAGCHPSRGIRRGARVDTAAPASDTPARAHPGGSTRGAPPQRATPGLPSHRDTGAIAHPGQRASAPAAQHDSASSHEPNERAPHVVPTTQHARRAPRPPGAGDRSCRERALRPDRRLRRQREGLVRAVRCSADAAVRHRRRRGVAARLRERGERDLLRGDEGWAVRVDRDARLEHLLAGREPDPRGALLRRGNAGHEGDRELRPERPDGRLDQPGDRPVAPRRRTAAGRRSRRPVGRRPLRAEPRSQDGRLVCRRDGHARHDGPSRRAARADGHGGGSRREPLRGRNAHGQDRQQRAARLARRARTGDPGLGLAGACGERRRQR